MYIRKPLTRIAAGLAIVVLLLSPLAVVASDAAAPPPPVQQGRGASPPPAPQATDQQRAALASRLESMGADPQQARLAVAQLSAQDVQVLNQHPNMLHPAGDVSDTDAILIACGVVIVVLLIIIVA